MCKKTRIKWASLITGTGAVVTAVVIPIVHEFRVDEKEMHDDESLIAVLTTKIHKMDDEIDHMKSAINLALRQGGH